MAKKDENMVKVDARILAAAQQEKQSEAPAPITGNALLLAEGVAVIGDGVEIKYDPESPDVMIGGKRVPKLELWQVCFAICDARVRDQMMPTRQSEVMHFTKVHLVKLKRDLKAGQIMKVRCHSSVETNVVEGLKGMMEQEKKSSIILPQ